MPSKAIVVFDFTGWEHYFPLKYDSQTRAGKQKERSG